MKPNEIPMMVKYTPFWFEGEWTWNLDVSKKSNEIPMMVKYTPFSFSGVGNGTTMDKSTLNSYRSIHCSV